MIESRISVCNRLIEEISRHDRRFFKSINSTNIARFELIDSELFYRTEHTNDLISMPKDINTPPRNLNQGKNIWTLVRNMSRFIYDGLYSSIDLEYWGYTFESCKIIMHRAKDLGFISNASFRVYDYKEKTYYEYKEQEISISSRQI